MSFKTVLMAAAAVLTTAACAPKSDVAEAPTSATEPTMMEPAAAPREATVEVGGAAMYPSKTIVENAANSADHTTLVTAVKAAGLVDTLSGAGPFTVFAPTNAAFAKLPSGTVESLTQPANKGKLTTVLTYHVVPGLVTAADLVRQIEAGGGQATLRTAQGGTLTAKRSASGVTVTDVKGNVSNVTIADVLQSNGVIHVVDTVLMPG